MKNEIEDRYSGPVMVIGWKGFPINGFCYDIIHKGEIKSRLNVSRSDNVHACYSLAFEDFKKEMELAGLLHSVDKYTGTIKEFSNRKYYKNRVKTLAYKLYLFIGRVFE